MGNTQSKVEILENLQQCAYMDVRNSIPSLCQLIGYRQKVAQELLKTLEANKENEEMTNVFLHCNEEIKRLLGIL